MSGQLKCLLIVIMMVSCPGIFAEEGEEKESKISEAAEQVSESGGKNVGESVEQDEDEVRVEREYYEDGSLRKEIHYSGELKDGKESWYFQNGHVEWETSWKEGFAHGAEKQYFESGAIQRELHWENGYKEGWETVYNENGEKIREVLWEKDSISILKDYETVYEKTHAYDKEIHFKKDKKHGKESWRYPNGKLYWVIYWENGIAQGFEREYSESGNIVREAQWLNGVKDGWEITYDESANIEKRTLWENGNIIMNSSEPAEKLQKMSSEG